MKNLRQLNFHHLYYFWWVAKEKHLTRAAEALHISQSALSMQIRKLEDSLGQPLFLREGRALHLTDPGRLVLGYAESIFELGDELLAVLDNRDDGPTRRLRVGAVSTLSRNFQENFLKPIITLPDVSIVHESAGFDDLMERLVVHKLDLVLSNRAPEPEQAGSLRCRRLARQPVCLVGPPRSAREPFRWPEDVAGRRLLLPGHSTELRTRFDLLCEESGVSVSTRAEVDDMAMLRLMARDSGGMAVVPDVVVQDELDSGLLEKYADLPGVFETFYAITTRRRHQPALLDLLLGR
jgi:LysR family transcriptional activator of nhaA